MTIICSFASGPAPFVMGDLLISGECDNTSLSVPNFGAVAGIFPENSGFAPIALSQKVCVVDDACAFAWSGHRIAAQSLARELKQLSRDGALSYEVAQGAIDDHKNELNGLDLSVTGWARDGDGLRRIALDCDVIRSPAFGEVAFAGSGSDVFKELIQTFPEDIRARERKINPIERGMGLSGALCALLLQAEFSGSTLLNFFGGGYEIARYEGRRFGKVDDISYFFWHANLNNEGISLSPRSAIAVRYDRENMILCFATLAPGEGVLKLQEEGIDAVRPLYSLSEEAIDFGRFVDLGLPRMNSRFTNHIIAVSREQNKPVGVFNRFEYSATGLPNSLRFTESGVTINDQFLRDLTHSLTATPH